MHVGRGGVDECACMYVCMQWSMLVEELGTYARPRRLSQTYTNGCVVSCVCVCLWAQRMNESRAETFTVAAAAAWQAGKLDKMPDSSRRDIWR